MIDLIRREGRKAAAVPGYGGTNLPQQVYFDDPDRLVTDGTAQAAFILGRPNAEEVRAVSLARDTMPQKSTFFFPKLLSGLLLRDMALED